MCSRTRLLQISVYTFHILLNNSAVLRPQFTVIRKNNFSAILLNKRTS